MRRTIALLAFIPGLVGAIYNGKDVMGAVFVSAMLIIWCLPREGQ